MWILECDGPLFHNKRLWLRPGTSHLFGRTKQAPLRNTESYVLDAKSVSKKHLKLSIAAVKAGSGSQLHTRTEAIIEDFSKLGTIIDGEKICQTTKVLKGTEHVIRVAKYEYALRLKWHPVVFSVANLTKAEKSAADPLSWFRSRLEPLDIKFVNEYIAGQTTHVVAPKRNIPAVLQGLIHARHVVTRDFVDAVVRAATEEPAADGVSEPRAPLEKDFDGAWPNAMNYVPPVAGEPVKRDASFLTPNHGRTNIFHGFTFVFCMKSQFEQLQPVIEAGGGKAILYESFEEGRMNPHEFVTFVKSVAGDKSPGEISHSGEGKGVVVVRITTKNAEWDAEFVQESDRQLNQRSIEQKELLDPILTLDTSGLRRRLMEEIDLTSTALSTAPESEQRAASKSDLISGITSGRAVRVEPQTQAKRILRIPVTQSRFRGFDDFDDESELNLAPGTATKSMPLNDITVTEETVGQPSSAPAQVTRRNAETNSRKRPTPEPDSVEMMASILPAAAAMKRRRINQPERTSEDHAEKDTKPIRPRKEQEFDVLDEIKRRRDEEERLAREDSEQLKEAIEGMDIQGPANLVQIEEMEVTCSHSASLSRLSRASSERWDERWNGLPNFKRFRRKGEERPVRRERVIVPVEETRKKDFGIGDDYWLEPSSRQKDQTPRESQVQSQTLRNQRGEDDSKEEDELRFHRLVKSKTTQESAITEPDVVEIIKESGNTALSASLPSTAHSTSGATSLAASLRKRPAPEPANAPPARKKTKPAWARDESEEDEDELAFPRARRGARKR
ncbi:uncharacterized protein PV09_01988 [Verruconis gallopava]|uniref:FHA domain-containing protein n=1 Tax=Verruconis gallopava TaxID=253628 RepID=A0A0D2AJS1_9PEZI|nr:uncharacterized protein PV09_01988 [Verruconis gallopava]KIW07113.1 hypothetical protein PV09_01988 [Verruconis gallopava]